MVRTSITMPIPLTASPTAVDPQNDKSIATNRTTYGRRLETYILVYLRVYLRSPCARPTVEGTSFASASARANSKSCGSASARANSKPVAAPATPPVAAPSPAPTSVLSRQREVLRCKWAVKGRPRIHKMRMA